MPRLLKKAELFSHVTEVGYIREKTGTHGATTLTAAAVKGATTLPIASSVNFDDGDIILIDSGESMEVAQQSGAAAIPLGIRSSLARAHVSGIAVVEAARTKLGDMTDDGVDLSLAEGDFNAIMAATLRAPAGYLVGHIAQMLEFSIEHLNPENLAAALGIPESRISGAGSAASPTKLDLLADEFASDTDAAWYFQGVRKDGTIVEIQAWGVEVDPTAAGQAMKFARGQAAPVRFRLRPTAGIRWLSWI